MKELGKPQITFDLAEVSAYLSEQPDVAVAYLFGSVARAQATPLSDIDVAILLPPELTGEALLERQLELAEELAALAGVDVQVTILNRAPPLLAYQVIHDGILLHQQDVAVRIEFEVRTLKLYFDVKPMLEFHTQVLFRRIQEEGLGRKRRDSGALAAAERVHQRLTQSSER
jgi:uncharacterized protein